MSGGSGRVVGRNSAIFNFYLSCDINLPVSEPGGRVGAATRPDLSEGSRGECRHAAARRGLGQAPLGSNGGAVGSHT